MNVDSTMHCVHVCVELQSRKGIDVSRFVLIRSDENIFGHTTVLSRTWKQDFMAEGFCYIAPPEPIGHVAFS